MEEIIFSLANEISLLSWIVIIIFPFKNWTSRYIIAIPISLLSLAYLSMVFTALGGEGGFSTLHEVMLLFQSEKAVLIGWIHYLAFDLMVGMYIVNNAKLQGINRFIIVPALILTFILGPVGLLTYFLIRIIYTKKYFHNY